MARVLSCAHINPADDPGIARASNVNAVRRLKKLLLRYMCTSRVESAKPNPFAKPISRPGLDNPAIPHYIITNELLGCQIQLRLQ